MSEEVATRDPAQSLVAAARARGVRDDRVLAAIGAVSRADFVPGARARQLAADRPIPIPGGQVTTQPSLIATMVETLELDGHERVLEIGTGLGYQAAILGRLASEVWTVERRPELAAEAERLLAAAGAANVHVEHGDGSVGLAAHAPYDGIIVAAACRGVPAALAGQLVPGGRLVLPIGPGGAEEVTLFRREGDRLARRRLLAYARFVPLV